MENTQYMFIDTFEQLQELAHTLDACKEFAIDLEVWFIIACIDVS